MESKPSWLQGPTNALGISVDLDPLRALLQAMSDDELIAFGKQMCDLVYPLTRMRDPYYSKKTGLIAVKTDRMVSDGTSGAESDSFPWPLRRAD
jgi:hypothetical protein